MPAQKARGARKQAPGKRQARQARVAAALIAGDSVTEIARRERVSRATASKEANSPEVQLLITSLVEAEREKIRDLWQKGLAAIENSFNAERSFVTQYGEIVNQGPDHYARLTGVKCLTQLLTAGRQAVKPEPAGKKTVSLEELNRLAAESEAVVN